MNKNKHFSQRVYDLEYHLAKVRGFTEEQAVNYAKRQAGDPDIPFGFARSASGTMIHADQVATMRFHGGK